MLIGAESTRVLVRGRALAKVAVGGGGGGEVNGEMGTAVEVGLAGDAVVNSERTSRNRNMYTSSANRDTYEA